MGEPSMGEPSMGTLWVGVLVAWWLGGSWVLGADTANTGLGAKEEWDSLEIQHLYDYFNLANHISRNPAS